MKIFEIDKNYLDYLRKFDNRVSLLKDENFGRKYIGIVLTINNNQYFAPLSSQVWKIKNDNGVKTFVLDDCGRKILRKNKSDITLYENGSYLNPLGAIKFNNMVPVPNHLINIVAKPVDIDNMLHSKRIDEIKYALLLEKQIRLINTPFYTDAIIRKAKKLYEGAVEKTLKPVSFLKVFCDFRLLEQKAHDYKLSVK